MAEMRYSKWALLLFGAGLVSGLAVVSVPLPRFGWMASLAMATGIVLLPVAAIADLRRRIPAAQAGKRRSRSKTRRRAPARRGRAKAKR